MRRTADIERHSSRAGDRFAFDSLIYNGFDFPPDGIGNHLGLFDRLIFDTLPRDRKSLSAIPCLPTRYAYGQVETDLHLKFPDRFQHCLFFDIARETWNPNMIERQIEKTIHHKRVFNAVTAVYLMWESDALWSRYSDLVSVYDFCIVTSSILDDFLVARGVDFEKLPHPYDFDIDRRARQLETDSDPIRFGISAGLWSRKGVSLLAEQFVRLFADDPGAVLSIHTRSDVSQPEFRDEFRALSRLRETYPTIELYNECWSRADYLHWLRGIDVYCFVSSGEGYSITPREALHLGIPVILHDAHVHREFSHLPGVVPVASRGRQRAVANTRQPVDVGGDWRLDEESLRDSLLCCRRHHGALKAQLARGYDEVLAHHDLGRIRRQWVEVLNRKYAEHAGRVRIDYPEWAESRLQSFPVVSDNLDLSSPGFASATGWHLPGRIYCLRAEHQPGHCLYGPNLAVTQARAMTVVFRIDVLSSTIAECVVNLEIYDSTTDRILVLRTIGVDDISGVDNEFAIATNTSLGQVLEFRIYWFGAADLCVTGLEVSLGNDVTGCGADTPSPPMAGQ